MPQSLKFRTAAACRIADIHRDRFNESVAAGNYKCAPETRPGASRIFAEDDLVALMIYGRQLKAGSGAEVAGDLACRVRKALDQNPKAKVVSVLRALNGLGRTVIDDRPKTLSTDNPVFERIEFEIGAIRAFVRARMQEEATVLGEED